MWNGSCTENSKVMLNKSPYLALLLLICCSCDKGYEIRFSNFFLEPMDSVVFGNNQIVFTNIERNATTAFTPIKSGDYHVTCITRSKQRLDTNIQIPKKGGGSRSLQVDGLKTFSLLEE